MRRTEQTRKHRMRTLDTNNFGNSPVLVSRGVLVRAKDPAYTCAGSPSTGPCDIEEHYPPVRSSKRTMQAQVFLRGFLE